MVISIRINHFILAQLFVCRNPKNKQLKMLGSIGNIAARMDQRKQRLQKEQQHFDRVYSNKLIFL